MKNKPTLTPEQKERFDKKFTGMFYIPEAKALKEHLAQEIQLAEQRGREEEREQNKEAYDLNEAINFLWSVVEVQVNKIIEEKLNERKS